ncbi:serine/threonine-protein kinase STY46 [Populus alba]|nr:serine/threonine-protein kinase STY46-like isoform X1 [Populus alba]
MGDTESCSSRAVDFLPRNQRQKLDVFNEVFCRLKESNNEEASLLGFENELWDHFGRLPPRYAMDVNAERAEDVIMHKRLLQMAHNPATRPAIEVRLVQVPRQSDEHSGDPVDSELQLQYLDYLGKHSIHPPPAFGSLSDSELLRKYQDKDITVIARPLCFRLVHEITISTNDKPKLLSQLASLLSEIGLSIQEAHAFSTIDGYALDVFVVDNWVPEDTERLRSMLFKEIPKIEDTERLRSMVFKQQPEHLEKEKQALPHHGSDCQISQFSGSFGHDEEVIINVDNIADVSDKETTIASKSCSGSPGRKAFSFDGGN